MKANTILQWYSTQTAQQNNSQSVTGELSCVNVIQQWYRHRGWELSRMELPGIVKNEFPLSGIFNNGIRSVRNCQERLGNSREKEQKVLVS